MDSIHQLPLNQKKFPQTWQVLGEALEQKVAPGFVVGLWEKKTPDQFKVGCWGQRREVPSPLPLTVDTVFDLASLTKIVATAPLAAALVERGWLSWTTPVSSLIPEFQFPEVQIQHLLSHTAGFIAWKPFWQKLRDSFAPSSLEDVPLAERQKLMRELVLAESPAVKPGAQMVYSDISFLILGFALEQLVQQPLYQAVEQWVWKPLGLSDFEFRVGNSVSEEIAATEDCPWRGRVLQGEVHDDNCWTMGGYGGHAGVFGTAAGLAQYIRALVMGQFVTSQTLNAMWSKIPFPPDCSRTLGWDTPAQFDSSAGSLFSRRSVGHLGFSGTSLWYDRDAEVGVIVLSNRVHPSRANMKIKAFRPRVHDAIRNDLKDFAKNPV